MKKKSTLRKQIYFSKLLLFGEHIINRGARGLAMPTQIYEGYFDFIVEEADDAKLNSNRALQQFAEYIIFHPRLSQKYNTNKLLEDIERGLYFHSTIPQGYGLGSSGALVAGICDQYRLKPIQKRNLAETKEELATLESFFHGRSSGLDPLVCFYRQWVLLENGEVKQLFDFPVTAPPGFKIFLLNTGKPRKTAPWVHTFLQLAQQPEFDNMLRQSYIKANDICIDSLLEKKYSQFWKSLQLLSQLQYDYLRDFVPTSLHSTWLGGLRNNEFHLKICGAGGGGFILGFCKADIDVRQILHGHEIIYIGTI